VFVVCDAWGYWSVAFLSRYLTLSTGLLSPLRSYHLSLQPESLILPFRKEASGFELEFIDIYGLLKGTAETK